MNRFWKKRTLIWIAVLTLLFGYINAQACVLLYSGGEMTDDGANMFMRSEEINTDDNKVYFVSPAGKHVEGEEYQGCTDHSGPNAVAHFSPPNSVCLSRLLSRIRSRFSCCFRYTRQR